MRHRRASAAVLFVLSIGAIAGCRDKSNGASQATATTASTGGTSASTSAAQSTGPVTDDDVNEVDQVLRRLDGELDRLDSDMATGEGEVQ